MNQEVVAYLRKKFESVNKQIAPAGLFCQSSYLRIDQPLINGQGNYRFDPMRQNAVSGVYDRKLDRNDAFIATGILLGFCVYNPQIIGICDLAFSPEEVALLAAAGDTVGVPGPGLRAIYNGKLTLKTGTEVTFDGFPTYVFRRNPANFGSEKTTATPAVTTTVNSLVAASDPLEATYYLPETLVLAGTKDQAFEVSFPIANTLNFLDQGDGEWLGLTLILSGFLIKNGAVVTEVDGKPNPLLFV